MIAYLKGIIVEVTESRLILDVNDIGYLIYISGRDASNMPGRGEEVKIHTYLNVKEDAMQLFGFLSEDDLEMYQLLLNVNGIGLILELKDKLSLEDAFEKKLGKASETMPLPADSDAKTEALEALTALGYSASDALKAVRKAGVTEDMDTETILKLALKQISFL